MTRQRRQHDDVAAPRDEFGHQLAGTHEGGVEVQAGRHAPRIVVGRRELADAVAPGIGDQHIDTAEALARLGEGRLDVRRVGSIAGDDQPADRLGHFSQWLSPPTHQDNLAAGCRELPRHRGADAGSAAGDEGYLAFELCRHVQGPIQLSIGPV